MKNTQNRSDDSARNEARELSYAELEKVVGGAKLSLTTYSTAPTVLNLRPSRLHIAR